jgi:hypothetical protein
MTEIARLVKPGGNCYMIPLFSVLVSYRPHDTIQHKLCGRSILDPAFKSVAVQMLSSAISVFDLGEVDEDELHAVLDWLSERRPAVEAAVVQP